MRLTYAVEISLRPYLSVALVERRVSMNLCNNLTAIRNFVTSDEFVRTKAVNGDGGEGENGDNTVKEAVAET